MSYFRLLLGYVICQSYDERGLFKYKYISKSNDKVPVVKISIPMINLSLPLAWSLSGSLFLLVGIQLFLPLRGREQSFKGWIFRFLLLFYDSWASKSVWCFDQQFYEDIIITTCFSINISVILIIMMNP